MIHCHVSDVQLNGIKGLRRDRERYTTEGGRLKEAIDFWNANLANILVSLGVGLCSSCSDLLGFGFLAERSEESVFGKQKNC